MRLVPEYDPVRKLHLCFVQNFFNSRFSYGTAICEIIMAARRLVEIELLVSPSDLVFFQNECDKIGLNLEGVTLNEDSPQRGILAEYAPIFAENEEGKGVGLVFQNPFLENRAELKSFSERMTTRLGFETLQTGFEFATTFLLVNEDMVLLSDRLLMGVDKQEKIRFFEQNFPNQSFHVVPALAGDVTGDLDMYLWPIAPRTWIVSEYPPGTV